VTARDIYSDIFIDIDIDIFIFIFLFIFLFFLPSSDVTAQRALVLDTTVFPRHSDIHPYVIARPSTSHTCVAPSVSSLFQLFPRC
jgi:hypothetical protein